MDLRRRFCNCIADLPGRRLMGCSSGVACAGTIAVYQCTSSETVVEATAVPCLPMCPCP